MSDTTTSTGGSDSLSAAELAYFQSGGTDTSGLGIEESPETIAPTQEPIETAPTDQAKAPAADDEDDIIVDENGKARDAKTGQFVPHAALHKERTRRKEVEAENLSFREKLARVEERLSIFNELIGKGDLPTAAPAAKPEAKSVFDEEPIDPEEDVFGALKQQQRINAELRRQMSEGAKAREQQEAVSTVKTAYQQDATAFMAKTPDFKDAYGHLISTLHRELELMGVSDEAERNRAIAEQERELVSRALAQKKSPSELIYSIAKTRGFSSAPSAAIDKQSQPAPKATADARIENVRRGQGSVISLAKAGGASGEGLTVEALASMNEADFAAMTKSLSKSQLRAIMGG